MSDTQNKNDLFEVIEKKDLKELECFLSDNPTAIDVNIQNENGDTPLHFMCCDWGDSHLAIRVMELLFSRGADVNIQNIFGDTPLHDVCWWWKDSHLAIRVMELLLDHRADINIQDIDGRTPLHFVCRYWRESHLAIRAMEVLLDHGADVNIQNIFGDTPLEILRKHIPNTKTTKFLEDWITRVRVRSLRGLVIRKIKEIKIPTEEIPDMCLELPDELRFSEDLKC